MKCTYLIFYYHATFVYVLECSDIWWCSGELYSGRMGFAGSFPEESLQRCDAGYL